MRDDLAVPAGDSEAFWGGPGEGAITSELIRAGVVLVALTGVGEALLHYAPDGFVDAASYGYLRQVSYPRLVWGHALPALARRCESGCLLTDRVCVAVAGASPGPSSGQGGDERRTCRVFLARAVRLENIAR